MPHLNGMYFKVSMRTNLSTELLQGYYRLVESYHNGMGRIIQKYPSTAKHFDIQVEAENGTATDIKLVKKDNYAVDQTHLGTYFIRNSLDTTNEQNLWGIYNTIRYQLRKKGYYPQLDRDFAQYQHPKGDYDVRAEQLWQHDLGKAVYPLRR